MESPRRESAASQQPDAARRHPSAIAPYTRHGLRCRGCRSNGDSDGCRDARLTGRRQRPNVPDVRPSNSTRPCPYQKLGPHVMRRVIAVVEETADFHEDRVAS